MSSYSFLANAESQQSGIIATDKIRVSTTTPIQIAAGYQKLTGTGNITSNVSNTLITGVTTTFTAELEVGYWIGDLGGNTVGIVANIANNTSLTLTANAGVALANLGYTYNQYGVPFALIDANSEVMQGSSIDNSFIVGQGNVIAFKNAGGTATPFSITELGMPHADTGTSGNP